VTIFSSWRAPAQRTCRRTARWNEVTGSACARSDRPASIWGDRSLYGRCSCRNRAAEQLRYGLKEAISPSASRIRCAGWSLLTECCFGTN